MAEGSAEKKFVVVEFAEEEPPGVAVVHHAWLHSRDGPQWCKAYWPVTRSSEKVKKMILSNASPDPTTWSSWKVKVLFSTDDYEKANKRCHRATVETDVDYVSESSTGKRKSRPNSRYEQSAGSSSDEGEEVRRPSPRKKTKRSSVQYTQPPTIDLSSGSSTLLSRARTSTPRPNSDAPNSAVPIPSMTPTRPSSTASRPSATASGPSTPSSISSTPSSRSSTQSSRSITPARGNSSFAPDSIASSQEIRQLNIKVHQLTSEMREVKKMCAVILETVQGQVAKDPGEEGIPEGIPSLPLDSVQDLDETNLVLQGDPAKRKQMVSYLKICGGRSVAECVTRTMLMIMEPSLAKGFNWMGQRGKQKLSASKAIVGVVFEAVRANFKTATLKDVEDAVKNYLKYAYQRVREAARHAPETQENALPVEEQEEDDE